MQDLRGNSVLITGATSGIGRAAALELASHGARLTLVGRDPERGRQVLRHTRELGAEAHLELADLTLPGTIDAVVARTLDAYQRIDAAVLSAATLPSNNATVALADLDDASIERDLIAEIRSTVQTLRALLRHMASPPNSGAAIVVVSSINGLGAARRAGLYSASKAAAIALAKSAALDYGARGVRVNALVAGPFDTPMLNEALRRQAPDGDADPVRRAYELQIPLGRIGRAEEAAAAIAWLCSSKSSYMAGASVVLDGGLTAIAR